MEMFLVWILLQLLVKVTSSKLSLDIQVHVQRFENLHNVEIRNGLYCCCDGSLCFANISDVISQNCTTQCDTYFKVYISDCSSIGLCSLNTSTISDSPSVINWPLMEVPLLMSMSETQNEMKIEAWDEESNSDADKIDSFTVPVPATVLNNTQSSSTIVQGANGIGELTLIYQNVSKGNTSCNSADQPSSSTCSNSEGDSNYIYSTSTCSSCLVSTKLMTSKTEQVTVTLLQTSATVTMSAEVAMTLLLWKTMAILLIVVTMSLAITCITLGIFTYRVRKTVNSEPISKFTTHEEQKISNVAIVDGLNGLVYDTVNTDTCEKQKISNVAIVDGLNGPVYDTVNTDTCERIHTPDPAKRNVPHDVYNTLYQQKGVSDCEYFNTGLTDTQEGKLYDLAYTTEDKLATPCEASSSLDKSSEN